MRGNGEVKGADETTLATRAAEMAAYDGLPPALRAALAEAPVCWSAVNILARWQRAAMVYGAPRATAAGLRVLREAELPDPAGPVRASP